MKTELRVQFAHGLEGSPKGAKARLLADHFHAITPAMDTADFDACVRLHAHVVDDFGPDVVVGSSFGGAVVCELMRRRAWTGPTLLLAPATRYGSAVFEPAPQAVISVVHATRDSVIDVEDSRTFVRSARSALITLHEVDDDHSLRALTDSGELLDHVREVARRKVKR